MTGKKGKRAAAAGAIVLVLGALAFVAYGNIGENLVYYWSPTELLEKGASAEGPTIRLGGVVKPGSVKWDPDLGKLEFECQQDHRAGSAYVKVVSEGVPPQMFRDGIGVVVEGTWSQKGVFSSSRLMVNHSNEYQKDHPHGEQVEPNGTTAQR